MARCERHYEIDLERQPLSATSGGPESRRFDLVLFAEVLEHLTVNPRCAKSAVFFFSRCGVTSTYTAGANPSV